MLGRIFGLLVALLMFFFSAYMYLRTGDWVAVVFILGSVGYIWFFLTSSNRKNL